MNCPNCGFEIKNKKYRSNNQNRYYFMILAMLSKETGMTTTELHEYLKSKFLSENVFIKTKGGLKELTLPRSTTELKTNEFETYLANVRLWAAEFLGFQCPLPNEDNVHE